MKNIHKLSASQKSVYVQQMMLHEICNGSNWCKDITGTRKKVLSLAHRLGVEPALILLILDSLLHPKMKALLKCFSVDELKAWDWDTKKLHDETQRWMVAHVAYQNHQSRRLRIPHQLGTMFEA